MTRKVVLFDTQYAPAVETAMYTTPEQTVTTIDKLVAYNATSGNRVVTVKLVPPDGTPTGTEFTVERKTVTPGQTWLFPGIVGNILAEGGAIWVGADLADSVIIRGSGREDPVEA